jgi:lipoyl(octanoyl) transferase
MDVLSTRSGGTAENMAIDFLLLQRYPRVAVPRFRHYNWHRPAFTFGYAQKIALVREQLAAMSGGDTDERELCRRPTGGGIVDHRDDWTYALVIPRGHPLEEVRATQSYRLIHETLARALQAQGVPCETKSTPDVEQTAAEATAPGICFNRAELHDVVHTQSGAKIAGAAQKRNKHGLLFQGSIWRPAAAAGGEVSWERFEEQFASALGEALGHVAEPVPWPDFEEDEVGALTEHYASAEWIAHR